MSAKKKPVTTGRAKEFTIDRSKWLQGNYIRWFEDHNEGSTIDSMLRDNQGMQCCLGFYTGACGVRGRTNLSSPGDLKVYEQKKLDDKFIDQYNCDTPFGDHLMTKNDASTISDAKREKYIAEKFASIGVKVKFVGKYPY